MTRLDALHIHHDHDRSPMNVKVLACVIVGLAGTLISCGVILYFCFGHWMRETNVPPTRIVQQDPAHAFADAPLQPDPRHPTLPWQDLAILERDQLRRLNNFGPGVSSGTAHVPIDLGMRMALQQAIFPIDRAAETQP